MRTMLAYQQDEESSADQAGVTFLNATKQSGPRHARDVRVHGDQADRRPGHQPLSADPPDAATAPDATPRASHVEPLLQCRRPARASVPPRPGQGEAVTASSTPPRSLFNRYPQTDQSLAAQLCPRHRHLSQVGRQVRHAAGRCADRCPAQLAVFLRDQRAVPVRERQSGRRGGAASAGRQPRPQRAPHPRHARPGPAWHQRCQARRRGHHQPSHRTRPGGFLGHGLPPARSRLCAQGGHNPGSERQEAVHGASRACIGGGVFL